MRAGIESLPYRSLPDCRRATTRPLDLSIGFIIDRVLIYFIPVIARQLLSVLWIKKYIIYQIHPPTLCN